MAGVGIVGCWKTKHHYKNTDNMEDLVISGSLLEPLELSPSELLTELSVYLYDKERLSMARAKKLAGLTQIEFQIRLCVSIHTL